MAQLDGVISDITTHIHDYTKSPTDFTRKRKLDPETLIKTTLNMQGNSLNAELYDAFPDIDKRMTASAYEQAKGKLSPQVFKDIFHQYNETMENPKTLDLARSYRVYAIDGCTFSVPHTKGSEFAIDKSQWKAAPKSKETGVPLRNLAMLHANMTCDIMNRTYQNCIIQTMGTTNERDAAIDMVKNLDNTNPFIVIMDRGYSGFNMFETFNRIPNAHYIIRVKNPGSQVRPVPPSRQYHGQVPYEKIFQEHTLRPLGLRAVLHGQGQGREVPHQRPVLRQEAVGSSGHEPEPVRVPRVPHEGDISHALRYRDQFPRTEPTYVGIISSYLRRRQSPHE